MAKAVKLTKKAIIIIVVASLIILSGATVGIYFGVTSYVLDTPQISIDDSDITANPDYTITIKWTPIKRAEKYYVEYEYATVEKGVIHKTETTSNSLTVARKRGEFKVRVVALAKKDKNSGQFSEWYTKDVKAIELDSVKLFNFKNQNGEYFIDFTTFTPVRYTYKGIEREVEYYEFTDEYNDEPLILSLGQMRNHAFHFPSGEEWEYKVRPSNYAVINEQIFVEPKELYEIFECSQFTTIKIYT
ncbi:MAG: hypothetical protein IKM01_00620 [Clostridia bacterium]|nr:hypothetical protein [Clostridia bacterium]